MYTFTNRFNGHSLRQRVRMINGRRSGWPSWWRYAVWIGLVSGMALACRHREQSGTEASFSYNKFTAPFPFGNATRTLANEFCKPGVPWFCQAAFLDGRLYSDTIYRRGREIKRSYLGVLQYPTPLCLRNGKLALKTDELTKVFINGNEEPIQALSNIDFAKDVTDLFVFQKEEEQPTAPDYPESYRILVSTSHRSATPSAMRQRWQQFLLANAVSDNPMGVGKSYSMNGLLEATFFKDKRVLVERTKDEHLKLVDTVKDDIDLYINGLPVDAKSIEGIHVREVDKLHARERPFDEWADGPERRHRFVLYVQTSPKRAKRDSSYYVFSPFYSGDF